MTEDDLDDFAMELAKIARARLGMEDAAGVLYQASAIIALNYLPLENVNAFFSAMVNSIHVKLSDQIAAGMAGGEVVKQ
ncbi:hypothetical protein [Sphingobium sp. CFD-1]|uniref:hypothetical protein n=1 Tax=Sphingobium sp. CFD-1 TaxID=2878545 RepID=UPI00214AE9C7|nr:hypothetical protein [Sphingobium sp. CFD-1]